MTDLPHPDVVDMMFAIGVSFEQFRAIYRTAWSVAKRRPASPDRRPTSADAADPAIEALIARTEARRERDKRYSAAKRADERATRDAKPADPVPASPDRRPTSADAPSPSLSKNPDLDLKRERGLGGVGEKGAGLMALPVDWQPNESSQRLAVERFGEIGAGNLLAKFRDYYADDPRLRTPRQWQRLYRDTWVKKERPQDGSQRSLALLTAVAAAAPPPPTDPLWQPVYARLAADKGENIAAAWFRDCRMTIDGDTAIITTATQFAAHYLTANFEGPVVRAVAAINPAVIKVTFVGASGNLPQALPAPSTGAPVAQTG